MAAAFQEISGGVGDKGLAGLVNNAGVAFFGAVEQLTIEIVEEQFRVNLLGVIAVTQRFLPLLRRARGRVINISSINGRLSMPFAGIYSASKFALEAVSDPLRMELKPWGITVSVVEPGVTATEVRQIAMQRWSDSCQSLPDAQRRLYEPLLVKTRELIANLEKSGAAHEFVTSAVVDALTASAPKTRGIMADFGALKWPFWLTWVPASAVGGAVVAAVIRDAANAVGYAVGGAVSSEVVGEVALGFVALGGVMGAIGIAQWLALRGQVSWAGWWVLASIVGGVVGGAVTLGVWSALAVFADETLRAVGGMVVGLNVFGIAQWFVLRRQVSWAGWLALASAVGLAAAPLGVIVIGTLVGGEVGRGVGFGGVYGAITGGALVILSSRARRVARQSTT